jgi:DNA-binding SARP family transcriptional activator
LLEARIAGKSEVGTLDLLDAFYPNEPEGHGKNTLKQQIYLIRASLGPDSVYATTNGYALGQVSSDAEDFLHGNDPSLWRGVYLQGFEGWISSVRDALTLALRSRIEAILMTNPSEAARLGQILCEMEPYEPEALRLTLRALRHCGDQRMVSRLFSEHRNRMLELNEAVPGTPEEFLSNTALA